MHHADPALLTIAWAAVAGLLAQVLGHRMRVPAIVPLLAIGMLLGPSGLGVVRPETLGDGLAVIVKLAVAVILFDGALNLRLADLGHAMREVRNLVTVGVLITWAGATLAAWGIADLSVPVAVVFGALVTVTGPTVVQPLLRRVPLSRKVKTVLEGEAILIDPVGAVLAVAVVDIMLSVTGVNPIGVIGGAWAYVGRLLVGLLVGAAGGFILSRVLKRRGLVPGELANLFTLASVWGVFALAEWLQGEAGITAAVAMGLAMQRGAVPEERRIRRFKEQLTVLGISLLFVLLAADLPLAVLLDEGWRGLLTVFVLMLLVRPLSVWASLAGSTMSWREKAFVAWISPRGIVAASVASLFALTLTAAGFAEGQRLLALAFLTIAVTVTIQGVTAGLAARLLGLMDLTGRAVIVVGAGPLGLGVAGVLRDRDRPVVLVDRNTALVENACALGFEAREGNALDEQLLADVGADESETVVALTTNSEVNALAAHLAHDSFGVARAYPALGSPARGAGPALLERVGGRLAFGRPVDVRTLEIALESGAARFLPYVVPASVSGRSGRVHRVSDLPESIVAVTRRRAGSVEIVTPQVTWEAGDELVVLTSLDERAAHAALDGVHGTPSSVATPAAARGDAPAA